MTIEEAKGEIPDIVRFANRACQECTANDWYCSSVCDTLRKARKLDYNRILKCYARNGGEMWKVIRYIKRAKI